MASHIIKVSDIPTKDDGSKPTYKVVSADSDGKAVVKDAEKDHKPAIIGGPSSK